MDESSEGNREEDVAPEATDEDVEEAVNGVESAGSGPAGPAVSDPAAEEEPSDSDSEPDRDELPDEVLNAPTKAEDGKHVLLEEYERENEPRWKQLVRQGLFWSVATAVAVGVTLAAVLSLRESGLSDGLAFILGSVGMAIMVGFVFLSLRR